MVNLGFMLIKHGQDAGSGCRQDELHHFSGHNHSEPCELVKDSKCDLGTLK